MDLKKLKTKCIIVSNNLNQIVQQFKFVNIYRQRNRGWLNVLKIPRLSKIARTIAFLSIFAFKTVNEEIGKCSPKEFGRLNSFKQYQSQDQQRELQGKMLTVCW